MEEALFQSGYHRQARSTPGQGLLGSPIRTAVNVSAQLFGNDTRCTTGDQPQCSLAQILRFSTYGRFDLQGLVLPVRFPYRSFEHGCRVATNASVAAFDTYGLNVFAYSSQAFLLPFAMPGAPAHLAPHLRARHTFKTSTLLGWQAARSWRAGRGGSAARRRRGA